MQDCERSDDTDRRRGQLQTYLWLGLDIFPLKGVVHKASVQDGDEGVVPDVRREIKVPVRLLDVPFFLELGSSLAIICRLRRA